MRSKKKHKKISVVLPAHNEEKNIEKMVFGLLRAYPKDIIEIVVVNDASTDKTREVIEKIARKNKKVVPVHRTPPCGAGFALRDGLKNVSYKAEYILTMDADFLKNVKDVKKFLAKIDAYDGLVGSRYLMKNSLIRYPKFKWFVNRSFHLLARLFLGIRQKDLTNNFKLYKKQIINEILPLLTSQDFSINAETGLYPVILNFKIGEVPVRWIQRTASMGTSKFKVIKVAPYYLRVFLRSLVIKYGSKN